MKYLFLEHTADVKFRAYGKDLKEVYVNSAFALKEAICGKLIVKEKITKEFNITASDFESLLYNFLEEFLYLLDAEDFLFSKIKELKINKEKFSISAVISGDNAGKYSFTNNVKAVTYSEMFVKNKNKKWVSQVVLDV